MTYGLFNYFIYLVRVLSGPATQKRMHVLRICLDAIRAASLLNEEDAVIACEFMELVETLSMYRKSVQDQCDTSFLFFTRELFPVCLSDIYAKPNESGRLALLVKAFRNCETLLMRAGASDEELATFDNYIRTSLDREIIQPLCRDIETDLRLHLHSARIAGVMNTNPFKDGVRDLSLLTRLPPICTWRHQVR